MTRDDPIRRTVVWTPIWDKGREGVGLEHLLLREGAADSVVLALDERGRPFRLAYALTWDAGWRLREARLAVTTDEGARTLSLETDGRGRWRDDRGERPDLEGCLDIDIWPTPFTNTFPIRRRPLAVGERAEFVMAWVMATGWAVFGTRLSEISGSCCARLVVGGAIWSRSARIVKAASSAPAPPSRCPVIDFVELTARARAWAPKTRAMAIASARSPSGVDVACAFR